VGGRHTTRQSGPSRRLCVVFDDAEPMLRRHPRTQSQQTRPETVSGALAPDCAHLNQLPNEFSILAIT
jgi:hypothetical protein